MRLLGRGQSTLLLAVVVAVVLGTLGLAVRRVHSGWCGS